MKFALSLVLMFFVGMSSVAGEEIQITSDITDQMTPTLYEDVIVWEDSRNGNYDIYMYNISTEIETRITTDPTDELNPTMYRDIIVWSDYRNGVEPDIYFYNLSSQTESPLCTASLSQLRPIIDGTRVVWRDNRNGGSDIYMYDFATATEYPIEVSSAVIAYPRIDGDIIVWDDARNGNYDIYMYNISSNTETRITTDTATQWGPAVYQNIIVWGDYRDGNYDIFMYNLSNGAESQVSHGVMDERYVSVYGNRIVWEDGRNGNYDIYMGDLSTGIETQITNNIAEQSKADIVGNKIVWQDMRNGNYDIYMTTIPNDIKLNFTLYQTRTDSQLYGPFFRVSVLDADNDADYDLIFGGYDWNNAGTIVYGNDGTGTYSIKQTLDNPSPDSIGGVPVGDIDNDGDIDLFTSNTHGALPQYIYKNEGIGSFSKSQSINEILFSISSSFGDINNDGYTDIVMSGGKTSATEEMNGKIYLNNKSGYFTYYDNISSSVSEIDVTYDAQLADMDNDGYLDIITVPGNNNDVARTPIGILKNDGTGSFSLYSTLPYVSTPNIHESIEIGDLNGDGYQDIVNIFEEGKSTTIYLNDGDGTFTEHSNLSDINLGGLSVSIGDADNDGDNDLVVSYSAQVPAAKNAIIYLNDGSGNFVKDFETTEVERATQVRFLDVDNDGKLDFVVGAYNPGSALRVYKNTISSTNTQPSAPTEFSSSYSNGKLTLTWNSGSDTETPVNLMMYNIKVGTSSGTQNIVSGVYGTPMKGNMQQRKSISLNIPDQDYYWSVQTIDSGLRASGWSEEQVYIPCTPNWTADSNACQPDDQQLISYTDVNSCGSTEGLPIDNGTYTGCQYPGERVAFYSDRDGNYEIYVMDAEGVNQKRLTNNPANDNSPVWSPDKKSIAFTSYRNGNAEVYVMSTNGSNQIDLTNNPSDDGSAAWSFDGRKIAFNSGRDGNYEIYKMDADGGNQTRLTNNGAGDACPAWSPDEKKIAFYSDRDGYPNREIYVMNANGSNQTRLTNNLLSDWCPEWSPDGSKLIFWSDRDGNDEIYIMNADGGNQARLTDNPAIDEHPAWSSDGSRIVFSSDRDGDYEIYTMNADGSDVQKITDNIKEDHFPHSATHRIPRWIVDSNLCQPNDQQLITYTDANTCGSTEGLPVDNGTYVVCDYCMPVWAEINNSCQVNDEFIGWYNDTNGCFAQTGLPSDNNAPANNSYVCDYCTPSITEGNTTCSLTDQFTTYYIDSNSCYALTGLVSDNVTSNITNTCDYCTPAWYETNTTCRPDSTILGWYADSVGCYAITMLPSDNNPPANNTYSCVWIDVDGDWIWDEIDPILGDETDINSTMALDLIVDGTDNITQIFEGVLPVEFKEANETLVEFDYNFSSGQIDLSEVFLEKQLANETVGHIIVGGINITDNKAKTLYVDDVDRNLNAVCIKDADMTDIIEITPKCNGNEEHKIPCNGKERDGYNCSRKDGKLVVNGLKHSGIIQLPCIMPTDGIAINQNAVLCEGDHIVNEGMIINSSNVILDCNNATISGQGQGIGIFAAGNIDVEHWINKTNNLQNISPLIGNISGFVDSIAFLENITIKNCFITGFDQGVNLSGIKNLNFSNNQIYNDGAFGAFIITYDGLFKGNVMHNPDTGLFFGGINSTIENNEVYGSKSGMLIVGVGNNISKNRAHSNTGTGIIVAGNNNLIMSNEAINNTGNDGITLIFSNNNTCYDNLAEGNARAGIAIIEGSNNRIINNTLRINRFGFGMQGLFSTGPSSGNKIINNSITSNLEAGIGLNDGVVWNIGKLLFGMRINPHMVRNNTFIDNYFENPGVYDLAIYGGAVKDNVIYNNEFYGGGVQDSPDHNIYCVEVKKNRFVGNIYNTNATVAPGDCQ